MKSIVIAVAILAAAAPQALAGGWSLGTNLGFTVISPDGGDNVTAIAIPAAVGGLQPGLRIGRSLQDPRNELFVDTGVLLYSTENFSSNALELTANYQWNLSPGQTQTPYLTAGFGFLIQSNEAGPTNVSATGAVFGFGAGFRRMIARGAGSLRAELRFDRFTEAKDGNVVLIPDGDAVSVKLGYDLWMKE